MSIVHFDKLKNVIAITFLFHVIYCRIVQFDDKKSQGKLNMEFLDALASLDLKLSVSEWVINVFGFQVVSQ